MFKEPEFDTESTSPALGYDPWLPRGRRTDAAWRWFCFPHAGGGASLFHRWAKEVSPEVEVLPIKLPGREDRLQERPFDNLRDLVEAVGPVIAEETAAGSPFLLVGNSVGGRVAFEITRWLRRQCRRLPSILIVAASRAPHLEVRKAIGHLPDSEFLAEVQSRFAIGKAHAELMRFLLPTLRADVKVLETAVFETEPPLECPILAFGGQDDGEVTAADIAGWREHTLQFSQRTFPGGHFFFESASRSVVQAIVRRCVG